MWGKLRDLLVILAPYISRYVSDYVQDRRARAKYVPGARMPWKLTVIVMDGSDLEEKAKIPVSEAAAFIEARTRFNFDVNYIETDARHDYTPYESDIKRYAMMGWNLPQDLIASLPDSTSYLFLYKMGELVPAQAGSALGLDLGLNIGGKPRPYATVPTDPGWYVNVPNQGFQSWAAQIVTHEIVNTIQAKIEAPPYSCGQLTGTEGVRCDIHESERLQKITEECYAKLGDNSD